MKILEDFILPSRHPGYHGASESFQATALQIQQNKKVGQGVQGSVLDWFGVPKNTPTTSTPVGQPKAQPKKLAPKPTPKPTAVLSKKRPSSTEVTQESSANPLSKVQRTKDKSSPNASSSSIEATSSGGLIPPSHQLEYHGEPLSFQSRALQLQQNRIEGRGFQGSVLDWLRISENKASHTVFVQGKGHVTTIPDLPIEWGVSEIKNVKYITFTPQLQAQAALAKEKITSFNLIISPSTEKISKKLWGEIRKSNGKVFEFNPITQTMIERILDSNKILR